MSTCYFNMFLLLIKCTNFFQTDGQDTGKPVYGLVGMQWGAFRDAQARREKYWYFGGLRGYATYLFTGLKVIFCKFYL